MQHLADEVARLARQVQVEIEDLRDYWSHSNESAESVTHVTEVLSQIERKLGDVHGDTRELMRRVPTDLGSILTELRRTLLLRLEESLQRNGSAQPHGAVTKTNTNESNQSLSARVQSLTPQERRVFQLCFQSGFLTYGEIAEHLDITPSAAKNLVNRMFQAERKRPLFAKRYSHGTASVGVRPELEKRILAGSSPGKAGRRKKTELASH